MIVFSKCKNFPLHTDVAAESCPVCQCIYGLEMDWLHACFFLMLFVFVVMLRQTFLIQHQFYHTLYIMQSFVAL